MSKRQEIQITEALQTNAVPAVPEGFNIQEVYNNNGQFFKFQNDKDNYMSEGNEKTITNISSLVSQQGSNIGGTTGTIQKMENLESLKTARQFVESQLEESGFIILPNGQISRNGKNIEVDEAIDFITLNFSDIVADLSKDERKNFRQIPREYIRMALTEKIQSVAFEALENLKVQLSFEDTGHSEIEKFQLALTGSKDELALACIKQFVWQVRRKLFGKSVTNHLMVVLFGQQGSGKSRALEKLLNPIWSLVLPTIICDIVDERFQPQLSKHFVAFIDEMAGSSRADIEKLKRIITAESVKVRKLGTNTGIHVAQNCTLLGASNKELVQIIKDTTGMRRFFELKTLPKIDWDTINSIDYIKLWKSIDEENNHGFLDGVKQELAIHQSDLVSKDSVDEFVNEFNILPETDNDTAISTNELFSYYKKWAIQSSIKYPLDKATFGKIFKSKGFDPYQKKESGKSVRGFFINEDNQLSELNNDNQDLY